jgi:hypothetical protein
MIASILLLAQAAVEPSPMPEFLTGCWEQRRDGGRWTQECWTDSRGGLMMGSGRDGQGDTVRIWEWMRIERAADGSVTFYASPKGAAAVPFKRSESSPDSVTFINEAHDFPQRVHYRRTTDGLEAEVSRKDGTGAMRWSYGRSRTGDD